ncbi:hypothetical protein QQZ08_002795 [Neonectria magnoliae]|uniref:PD-(D/E)XK nuclease-like domain-containing protein n=1 Tax=Neonectria magnoliae TaxID=2732573 RepID=A0ABR1IB37_9HYPO
MSDALVLDWLNDIPPSAAIAPPVPPTRKRSRHPLPPTPTRSDSMPNLDEGPSKRQHMDETTPRPNRKRIQMSDSGSSHSFASRSERSGRSSPRKHLNALECSDEGVVVRGLASLVDPPPRLAGLLKDMRSISRGRGILCSSARSDFTTHPDSALSEMGDDEACFSATRSALGHVPDPASIIAVLNSAVECEENLHAESTWNMLVHSEVLRLALQPPDSAPFSNLINYMPCSTAAIIPRYLPASSPSKKIDFCVYIDPRLDPSPTAQSGIHTTRIRLPEQVFNHTDYYPLRQRPIALPIETKKTGEGWDGATLQLGVWQAAHWNFLRLLLWDDDSLSRRATPYWVI